MRFRNRVFAKERETIRAAVSGKYLKIVQYAINKKPSLIPFILDITVALEREDELSGVVDILTRKENSDIIENIVWAAYRRGAPEEVNKEDIKEILLSMKRDRLALAIAYFMEINEISRFMWTRVNNAIDYAYGKYSPYRKG